MIFEFPAITRSARGGETPNTFRPPCFKKIAACSLAKESCSLAKMLSLLPAPKHYLTPLSTVEKGTCKQRISASFLGTRTIFIRALPKIFCLVNGPPLPCQIRVARQNLPCLIALPYLIPILFQTPYFCRAFAKLDC